MVQNYYKKKKRYSHNASVLIFSLTYFNLANASLILAQAFSILGILFAKENLTQLGSPNASPITEETCAVFNKYMLKSAALAMVCIPSDLP